MGEGEATCVCLAQSPASHLTVVPTARGREAIINNRIPCHSPTWCTSLSEVLPVLAAEQSLLQHSVEKQGTQLCRIVTWELSASPRAQFWGMVFLKSSLGDSDWWLASPGTHCPFLPRDILIRDWEVPERMGVRGCCGLQILPTP